MFAEIKSQGLQPHPVTVKLMNAVSIIVFERPAKEWQKIRETLFTDTHLHYKLLASALEGLSDYQMCELEAIVNKRWLKNTERIKRISRAAGQLAEWVLKIYQSKGLKIDDVGATTYKKNYDEGFCPRMPSRGDF